MKAADLLLYNGTLVTMNPLMPQATALAIQGERIVWVGDQKDLNVWIGAHTRLIDLQGSFVYPGLIDTHAHITYSGLRKNYLHLEGKEKSAILEEIRKYAEKCQQGEWIIGVGWDEHFWLEKTLPLASDLDKVAPHHPVVLQRIDTHLIWVNSYALQLSGIHAQMENPSGGKIDKDVLGFPTGILIDKAAMLVYQKMPDLTKENKKQLIKNVLQECLEKGITMIHDAAIREADYEAFKSLSDEDLLNIRIYMMGVIQDKEDNNMLSLGPHVCSPFLELRCLKIWMDGALGSRGAALFEPYQDHPQNKGLMLWEEEDLISVLKQAKSKGFQVAIHGIGDRASHFILNAYEKIGVAGLRWRIEHAQLLALTDIERLAKLQVIAAVQPLHATIDMAWLEERVGTARAKDEAFMWRTLLDHHVMVCGGSDAPVVDFNPLWGIYAAITRQDDEGKPKKGWYPKQRMSREEALKIYTIYAAYACFREHELGSLGPGKLADLTILPENLLTCEPKALLDMQVLYTIVNGKICFQK